MGCLILKLTADLVSVEVMAGWVTSAAVNGMRATVCGEAGGGRGCTVTVRCEDVQGGSIDVVIVVAPAAVRRRWPARPTVRGSPKSCDHIQPAPTCPDRCSRLVGFPAAGVKTSLHRFLA